MLLAIYILLIEGWLVIIEDPISSHSGPVIRALVDLTGPERRLHLASFGPPWFTQTEKILQD